MSPNPIVAMAPINVQTTAIQGSTNSNANQQRPLQTRPNTQANSSPRHRKNKNQRDRNTPSPKQRGSPKPKASSNSWSSRRNYTPPPRFQKMEQFDGANNNSYSSSSSFSYSVTSSDDNSNDSTKENYAGAKFHSEAPSAGALPMPPSSWLVGCSHQAAKIANPSSETNAQLGNELKRMLKVAL